MSAKRGTRGFNHNQSFRPFMTCLNPKWAWHRDHHLVVCTNCGEAWTVEELETIGNVMYTAAQNLELLSGRRI